MDGINLEGVVWFHPDQIDSVTFYPGVRKKTLFQDPRSNLRVLQVEFDPGSKFIDLDVHETGSEEVFVLEGVFNDGFRDYPAGSFIHNPTGSAHVPQSRTGCKILVFFPGG